VKTARARDIADVRQSRRANAWQMATIWGLGSPATALFEMNWRGWRFVGYDDEGQESYVVPDGEPLKPLSKQ
jgi:hypothetical protein